MLEIIKRDGTTQQFKKSKIVNAIHGAYDDTDIEFDLQLATQIAEEIKDEVQLAFDSFGNVLSIENVQDLVETRLMKEGEPEVAKKYILYRNKHKEIREHWRPYKSFKYLSNDFLRQYADKEDPFGTQLSKFTFYRTYSRFIKEVGRRETWLEMNARIVDYIIDLDPQGHKELAEELFDYLYNFKMFTSGRIRYTGGTKAIKKHFQSAFNCSFMIIDTVEKFSELCHLLMLGSGMGFRIFKEDVEQVEPVRQDIELIHKSYEPKEPQKRQELTTTNLTDNILEIVVGDSKAGWSNAIGTLFDYLTNKRMSSNSKFVKTILINYDNVRPEGELLKTFLGRASGPQPLKKVMKNINRIVKESDGRKMSRNRVKLKSIDILDIAGLIAEAIVVGGVRRSAMIALVEKNDSEVVQAKTDLYTQQNGEWVIDKDIAHRQMSNNTILYKSKPSREELHEHIQTMATSGEPGIANLEELKRRKEDAEGLNPCFTGDMELLTVDGYKKFKDLSGKEVGIINKDGFTSTGKVWSNGVKEVVEVKFESDKKPIKCTPDHTFMLVNGKECEAKDLVGKELLPYDTASMNVPKVKEVISIGKEQVYDFNEPLTNWGIVNGVTAHNCAEILLQDRQHCNLTAINMMEFLDDAGGVLYDDLERAQELATYVAFIISMQELDLLEWEEVAREDRIIGVSMTGYQDFLNKGDISNDEKNEILKFIRRVAHSHNEELANKYNTTKAELVTSAQPAGTVSILPDSVSSGIHWSHSPYYIRRVRVSASDPVAKSMVDSGFDWKPEVGQSREDHKTKVFEFPIKAPKGKTKYDVGAIEQLEEYKDLMEHYVDHNASITVHVKPDEWDKVEQWLWNNWDVFVGISFLPLDDSFYELLPYEAIDEETYQEMKAKMPDFDPEKLTNYEDGAEFEIDESGCEKGSCPVR